MKHALLALSTAALLAGLSLPVGAKDPPARAGAAKPAPKPEAPGPVDEAVPGVDPAVLAQCRAEADDKRLKGEARSTFMKSCIEPED